MGISRGGVFEAAFLFVCTLLPGFYRMSALKFFTRVVLSQVLHGARTVIFLSQNNKRLGCSVIATDECGFVNLTPPNNTSNSGPLSGCSERPPSIELIVVCDKDHVILLAL